MRARPPAPQAQSEVRREMGWLQAHSASLRWHGARPLLCESVWPPPKMCGFFLTLYSDARPFQTVTDSTVPARKVKKKNTYLLALHTTTTTTTTTIINAHWLLPIQPAHTHCLLHPLPNQPNDARRRTVNDGHFAPSIHRVAQNGKRYYRGWLVPTTTEVMHLCKPHLDLSAFIWPGYCPPTRLHRTGTGLCPTLFPRRIGSKAYDPIASSSRRRLRHGRGVEARSIRSLVST